VVLVYINESLLFYQLVKQQAIEIKNATAKLGETGKQIIAEHQDPLQKEVHHGIFLSIYEGCFILLEIGHLLKGGRGEQ
jgi:hypothetical protein